MTTGRATIAHITTVDLSLRYLIMPQLLRPLELGMESVGISAPGEWVPELEEAGIRHLALEGSTRGMSLGSDLRAAVELFRVLHRLKPDVLHTHNPKPGVYGRIVGRLAGVPVVVNTVHGLYAQSDDPLMRRAVVYALEWLAARFSDAELVQSREDLELMRRLRLAPASRLRHLGNGIDLTRFDPERLALVRPEARGELGIAPDRVVVGMVGRLVVEKGYRELISAAGRLDHRYEVVCVGPRDAEKADALTEAELAAGAEAGVRFLGMRADVDRLYSAMDLFVLPSHREGFPRSAMEAAACGLPVVATDIRGCREVVEPGSTGLLVPVEDPGALAEAIDRLGSDPDLRRRMGMAGRAKAVEDFDERRVVQRVMSTYAAVARAKGLHRLAAALQSAEGGPVRIRPAAPADSTVLAGLHSAAIDTGFLASLGPPALEVMYRELIDRHLVLVAEDDTGPVGYVAGTADTRGFTRRLVRRRGVRAAVRALPRVARPGVARRLVETLRYGGEEASAGAELLSLAVIPQRRNRGIGGELVRRLLEGLEATGVDRVRVVVGMDNRAAVDLYERAGFEPAGVMAVHRDRPSHLLVWKAGGG